MKITTITLICLMFSNLCFSQKKSKTDPKDLKIDSLTSVSTTLKHQVDSLSIEIIKYRGLYDAVKEKVLHRDFDPSKSAFLIDSLKSVRDSTSAALFASANATGKADSITILLKENITLKTSLDSLTAAWKNDKNSMDLEEIKTLKAVSGLKQLKELLDEKIITETEFVALKKKYLDNL